MIAQKEAQIKSNLLPKPKPNQTDRNQGCIFSSYLDPTQPSRLVSQHSTTSVLCYVQPPPLQLPPPRRLLLPRPLPPRLVLRRLRRRLPRCINGRAAGCSGVSLRDRPLHLRGGGRLLQVAVEYVVARGDAAAGLGYGICGVGCGGEGVWVFGGARRRWRWRWQRRRVCCWTPFGAFSAAPPRLGGTPDAVCMANLHCSESKRCHGTKAGRQDHRHLRRRWCSSCTITERRTHKSCLKARRCRHSADVYGQTTRSMVQSNNLCATKSTLSLLISLITRSRGSPLLRMPSALPNH